MEPSTTQSQTTAPASGAPLAESSHKNLYMIIGSIVGGMIVIGAFVGMYMWQESTHATIVNDITSQKVLAEQQVADLKEDLDTEKQRSEGLIKEILALTPINPSEKDLLAMFKNMLIYKYAVSATSTVELTVIQKTENADAYKIGVGINCKKDGSEVENQGCAGLEKFYKRVNGTWKMVGFNGPFDEEAEAFAVKVGF